MEKKPIICNFTRRDEPTFGVGATFDLYIGDAKPIVVEQWLEDNSGCAVFAVLMVLEKQGAVEIVADHTTREILEDIPF